MEVLQGKVILDNIGDFLDAVDVHARRRMDLYESSDSGDPEFRRWRIDRLNKMLEWLDQQRGR